MSIFATRFDDELCLKNIYRGKSAEGLYCQVESVKVGKDQRPDESCFIVRDGRKVLRSGAYAHQMSRQKDRPKPWYDTEYVDMEHVLSEEGDADVFTWRTPVGEVVGRRRHNHFFEYPVKTAKDLEVWTYVHTHQGFKPNPVLTDEDRRNRSTISINWSPVQQLLQFDIGLENFYYLLADEPVKMAALLDAMQERCLEKLRLGTELFPNAEFIYWGENTSSSAISPTHYRQLTLPHIRSYAALAHKSGKRLVVHMCGLLSGLLDCFIETGMDGIHSVTPPPLGDCPYTLIREKFPSNFTILGRFNAHFWVGRSKAEIQEALKRTIYPELLDSPFALLVTTDANPDIPAADVETLIEALNDFVK